MKLQKETFCLQPFIVKRVFILNSIAFNTGHSLEVGRQCKEVSHWSYSVIENKTFKENTLIKPATYFTHEWSFKRKT